MKFKLRHIGMAAVIIIAAIAFSRWIGSPSVLPSGYAASTYDTQTYYAASSGGGFVFATNIATGVTATNTSYADFTQYSVVGVQVTVFGLGATATNQAAVTIQQSSDLTNWITYVVAHRLGTGASDATACSNYTGFGQGFLRIRSVANVLVGDGSNLNVLVTLKGKR